MFSEGSAITYCADCDASSPFHANSPQQLPPRLAPCTTSISKKALWAYLEALSQGSFERTRALDRALLAYLEALIQGFLGSG